MDKQLTSTKKFSGARVVGGKKRKRIGKVRHFVFHPRERRCVGFLVKRPDAALMFHRKDLFVALDGFTIDDGDVVVSDDAAATDRGAVKALGIDWDECVIWVGMPVTTREGDFLGYVDTVEFDLATGEVESVSTEEGIARDVIVGKRLIPGNLILGFKRGAGARPSEGQGANTADASGENADPGAILVSDEALAIGVTGGAAAAAGKATAVVAGKARKQAATMKPKAQEVARKTGEAVEAATFAAGKQIGRASGMFAAFKEEYDKAAHGDDR